MNDYILVTRWGVRAEQRYEGEVLGELLGFALR